MNELAVQTRIRLAVNAAGGAAHKLSTPFKIGVCDLLVKLPNCPAALFEVKLSKFSARIVPDHVFRLDITHNQIAFLDRFAAAGMTCGVISTLLRGRDLWMASLGLDAVRAGGYTTTVGAHRCRVFKPNDIASELHRFCCGLHSC